MTQLTGPILAEYQSLFSSSATNGGPGGSTNLNLGQKVYTGDGREFRFCLAGATSLVPGKLQQSAVETTAWENIAVAAAAVGATSVTITASITATANILAGGYLIVAVTPGQGYQYQIVANTAVSAAANMVVTLADPIQVALTTSSTVTLVTNPYSNVIICPTALTGTPVGVPVFAVTNAQYGWLQVTGAAAVLADDTLTVGTALVASDTVSGAVTPLAAASTLGVVGTAMNGITDTQYGPVWLNIG